MRIVVAAMLLVTATAEAHIALVFPPPRTAEQKAGPCGVAGSTRGTAMSFQPGEVVTMEWDETVDHPGHYRIAFDSAGTDAFQNPNNPADNFPSTMVEPIADKTGGHYTQMITMPMTPCTDCTLQLMQIMTTAVPYDSFYYQCADVTIEGDPATGPAEVQGGCSTGAGAGPGMLILGAVMWRRRRRSVPVTRGRDPAQ